MTYEKYNFGLSLIGIPVLFEYALLVLKTAELTIFLVNRSPLNKPSPPQVLEFMRPKHFISTFRNDEDFYSKNISNCRAERIINGTMCPK